MTTLSAAEFRAMKPAKTNKYRAKKVTIDGFTYDSTREAEIVEPLRILERQGEIYELERQKPYVLQAPNGTVIGIYKADAAYYDPKLKRNRVIDVKGVDTPLSAWKRKHVKAQYGIEVEIVR